MFLGIKITKLEGTFSAYNVLEASKPERKCLKGSQI
jgi:hypothetical protein